MALTTDHGRDYLYYESNSREEMAGICQAIDKRFGDITRSYGIYCDEAEPPFGMLVEGTEEQRKWIRERYG